MILGIKYIDKHSYKDLGLILIRKNIDNPKKIKTLETVPGQNGSYDFSEIFGDQTYEERSLEYVFSGKATTRYELNLLRTELTNFFMNAGKEKLYDDDLVGWYFLAECIDMDFEMHQTDFEITLKFKAYPFMLKKNFEGADIWDEFNFILDYAQTTQYNVIGSKDIILYNNGSCNVVPTILTTSKFELTINNEIYKISPGETRDFRIILKKGENIVNLKGSGKIEFIFRMELI